ncbi:hypothetical protein [Bythopirellula polymerisocia]|uniref:Uncharacterized protein n=1 Tax=Bythopirellula polymerisocia TaxID=2528003 RepID=A0A5C6CEP5_9BACT|nr:hypothetical protein [Bythopirellula polymerisocia]TWU21984.1 hypothetical protein Pla144_44510 [Bythopirellula polymerisocia]
MASNNRAAQINKVLKVVKKHYKPSEPTGERTVLEHLVFACCLENSLHEDAEKVFDSLKNDYFDWNEVRVSSVRELSEHVKALNDSEEAATRLKRVLQSVFETLYSFDLEPLKKQNIGQSIKQFQKFHGTTPFSISYVTQHGLGGHSIPINQGLLEAMHVVGVISDAEAAKGSVPGLERAIPKTKATEVSTQLHQLGVELHRSPYGPTIRKILLEIDPSCKDRLPKRQSKKADSPTKETSTEAVAPSSTEKKKKSTKAQSTEPVKKKVAKKKSTGKKALPKKKTKTAGRVAKKTSNKKLTKKKPR